LTQIYAPAWESYSVPYAVASGDTVWFSGKGLPSESFCRKKIKDNGAGREWQHSLIAFEWRKPRMSVEPEVCDRPKILVIDNESRICDSLKVLLEGQGYTVSTASGGKEGMESLSGGSFALVITDVVMPDTDGLAIMDYVKDKSPHTLVIVITEHVSVQSAVDSLRKGAFDYLTKPFDPEELAAIVKRATEQVCLKARLNVAEEALRRSEERYRVLVENSLVGIYIRQGDRIRYANNTFEKIFGYTREELLKCDFWSLVHPEDREMVRDMGIRRLKGKTLPYQYEARGIRKDGKTIWVSRRNVCIDHEGSPAILGNIVDITELKQIEEHLVRSEKLRAMGEMASGIAHDFNNVLSAIIGNTELLLSAVSDGKLCKRLNGIETAARDASHTVKRLQDFTRIRKDDTDFERIDIHRLVDDVISITRPRWKDQYQEKGIAIDLITDFKEVPPVAGHPFEVREVLTNLIFNALDAMPEGGRLGVGTRHVFEGTDSDEAKDGFVEIYFSDTGFGMSERIKKKIFDPFFTTKGVNSSGLGLSVSYGIITRHGGSILVETKEGEGARFIVRLPVSYAVKERAEEITEVRKDTGKARILVIEDDSMVIELLDEILTSGGHDVTCAQGGMEGVQRFKDEQFDMVFTDLGMPEMTGWDVARSVKDKNSQIPVALITGWGEEFDQSRLKDAGVDLIVAKPFTVDRILRLVDEAMDI
jgi:PAS domain S-box-containing protein